jgi:SAM-dependent methyltransferase
MKPRVELRDDGPVATPSDTDRVLLERCAWCEAEFDPHAPRRRGRVLCRRCGAYTTSPWPDEATLEAAYGGAYRPTDGRFSGPGDRLLALTRSRLAARIDGIAPPGGVLDVGAGPGTLVRALRRRGRPALGLERTDVAPATGGAEPAVPEPSLSGPSVIDARLGDVRGTMAAVVFWHSLEHLPRPLAALRQAVALLGPGGVVAIAVPNAASLQARVFGDEWLHLDLPRHLTHVPATTLIESLERLDLQVERVSYWRGGQVLIGWLHGLVRALPGHPSLYDALRRPDARWQQMSSLRRGGILLTAVLLAPVAAVMSLVELAMRRGGSVYVEARND